MRDLTTSYRMFKKGVAAEMAEMAETGRAVHAVLAAMSSHIGSITKRH
jgi:hypothetical protein